MAVNIGAELSALPLEFLIAAPLTAAIKGQALAAASTGDFIQNVLLESDPAAANGSGSAAARMVSFNYTSTVPDPNNPSESKEQNLTLSVPLMAMVHTPNLRIHDMAIGFEFKIRDVVTMASSSKLGFTSSAEAQLESKSSAKAGVGGGFGIGSFLNFNAGVGASTEYSSKYKFTATGSATYQRSERHQTDRSATYKFNLNVKEETPEGFRRVLEILNNAIVTKTA
jgi:hypothetical protein